MQVSLVIGVSLQVSTCDSLYPKPLTSLSNSKGNTMSYINDLRSALATGKDAKENARQAGTGTWANYVRSTCYPRTPATVEGLDSVHKELVGELNNLRELSKDEKNSLRSAKSVIAKAVTKGVDVWQRYDGGCIIHDDQDNPTPKGKSELQDAKTDAERLMGLLEQFDKTFNKESREPLLREELEALKDKLMAVAASVGQEYLMLQD
jgi:hypothetical protein